MKRILLLILSLVTIPAVSDAQGKAYNWQIGYQTGIDAWTTSRRALLHIDSLNALLSPTFFKMPYVAAQANISDEIGNLLLTTNGCWIADATGDTMQNGSGLNPGSSTNSWCTTYSGIPFPQANLILPYPGDSSRYILFHETGNNSLQSLPTELYYSVIDISKANGLGAVDSNQKNIIVLQDTLSQGIIACKHANGRDWWIVALKDSSDLIYKILLTQTGISSISTQNLNVPFAYLNGGQPTFSPDGSKFAYSWAIGSPPNNWYHDVRLFDFDRCSGMFSNPRVINVTDTLVGIGLAFSPNSRYLYATSIWRVFQIDTDTATLTVDTVALWDGYSSPNPPFYTHFWLMYLAPNGKIYISTDYGTLDLHVINSPDSSDTLCNVLQHSLHLPCYQFRANVNHPNYYLGRILGSPCDTVQWTGLTEVQQHDFHFSVFPNPNNGIFRISYLLPQNQKGVFVIYDVTGKIVYRQSLPQWSTLQQLNVSGLSEGIYNCVLTSANYRVSKTIAIINE